MRHPFDGVVYAVLHRPHQLGALLLQVALGPETLLLQGAYGQLFFFQLLLPAPLQALRQQVALLLILGSHLLQLVGHGLQLGAPVAHILVDALLRGGIVGDGFQHIVGIHAGIFLRCGRAKRGRYRYQQDRE